jgi:hypothetical protein
MSGNTTAGQAMRAELHCHTWRSFDALTTDEELLERCMVQRIRILAITEHDILCGVDIEMFARKGIIIIPGCEFTADTGAHIIGLFVVTPLPIHSSREEILRHIAAEGGLAYLPHPFKPGSGYFCHYAPDAFLSQVRFIEAYNGGWDSSRHLDAITEICAAYGMLLVAASDAHKAEQVGVMLTEFEEVEASSLKDMLSQTRQDRMKMLVDSRFIVKLPRRLNWFQRWRSYQYLVGAIPIAWKRPVKKMLYRLSPRDLSGASTYVEKKLAS